MPKNDPAVDPSTPPTRQELRYVDLPHVRAKVRGMRQFKDIDTDYAIDVFIKFYEDKDFSVKDYYKRLLHWLKTEWRWKDIHQEHRLD